MSEPEPYRHQSWRHALTMFLLWGALSSAMIAVTGWMFPYPYIALAVFIILIILAIRLNPQPQTFKTRISIKANKTSNLSTNQNLWIKGGILFRLKRSKHALSTSHH